MDDEPDTLNEHPPLAASAHRSASPRPYPSFAWPRLSASEVRILNLAARTWPTIAVTTARRRLLEVLGVEVHGRLLPPVLGSVDETSLAALSPASRPADLRPHPTAVFILLGARNDPSATAAVELETPFAWLLVDLVLGGELPANLEEHPAVDPLGAPLDDVGRGILVYLAAKALETSSWRVLGVGTTELTVQAILGVEAVQWPIELRLGGRRERGALWMAAGLFSGRSRSDAEALPRIDLGPIELPMSLEIGSVRLSAAELASLEEHDVIIPDECHWGPPPGLRRGRLKPRGGRRWSCWCTAPSNALEVVGALHIEAIQPELGRTVAPATTMTESTETILEAVGDVAIDLAVEIAELRLPLEELATLREGSVLHTGKAIDDRVSLRAGERTIAEGELIDIEGQIGIRILRLASSPSEGSPSK